MGRELDGYRENLELLNIHFPGVTMLTIPEVKQLTGFKSTKTVMKYLGNYFVGDVISKVYVARWMCGGGKRK